MQTAKLADTQQKNTADKSDTQQGIDIAAYEKKLADNRENYKLGCEQYSTDTDIGKKHGLQEFIVYKLYF